MTQLEFLRFLNLGINILMMTADMKTSRPWQGRGDVTLCVITNSDNEYLHWHLAYVLRSVVLMGTAEPFNNTFSTTEHIYVAAALKTVIKEATPIFDIKVKRGKFHFWTDHEGPLFL